MFLKNARVWGTFAALPFGGFLPIGGKSAPHLLFFKNMAGGCTRKIGESILESYFKI